MTFRIPKSAKDWFKGIDKDSRVKGFSTDFDILYFCLMAGLITGKKAEYKQADTNEIVAYFPGAYAARGKLLIGLFLKKELDSLGISLGEKKTTHAAISSLIDPSNGGSFLSEEGMREFTKYVNGGYEALLGWFDEPPVTLESFLRVFKLRLDAHPAGT